MSEAAALPKDKSELLKLIGGGGGKDKGGKNDAVYLRNLRLSNQAMRQDMHREKVECGMMELEDYTFKPEGKIRLQRFNEEVQMGEEDERSRELEVWHQERQRDELRSDVRRQAALLEEQEAKEKAAKKASNDARRQAVLDRIRKKEEAEAAAVRALEEAQRAVDEEAKRAEMRAAALLESDRSGLAMEDELSLFAEQQYREELVVQAKLKVEADRAMAWEEGERRKAEAEELTRAERIQELKAKRARLKEMQARAGGPNPNREALEADAAKQAKQMRIQNKAKTISRRIKAGGKVGQIIPPSPARESPVKQRFSHLAESEGGVSNQERIKLKSATVPQAFLDEVAAMTTEGDLREVTKELMSAKRRLRLEQRQLLSEDASPEQEARMTEISNLVLDITLKEKVVKYRTKVVKKMPRAAATPQKTKPALEKGDEEAAAAAAAEVVAVAVVVSVDQPSETVAIALPTSPEREDQSSEGDKSTLLFSQAEAKLREAAELAEWFQTNTDADHVRRAGILAIEMHELGKKITKGGNDALGYIGKLETAGTAVTAVAAESKERPATQEKKKENKEKEEAAPKLETTPDPEPVAGSNDLPKDVPQNVPKQTETTTPEPEPMPLQVAKEGSKPESKPEPTPEPAPAPGVTKEAAESKPGLELEPIPVTPPRSPRVSDEKQQEPGLEAEAEAADTVDFESLPGWHECVNTSMTTAAHHAAFYGFTEVLEFLAQYFDVFIQDDSERTPLHYAAMQNHLDCVVCLASLDAQWLDVGDAQGNTPLHASVLSGQATTEVLNFLLSCEANPDTANNTGATPCHVARSAAALEVLYNYGATPYCVDAHSRMPLWYACERGSASETAYLCSVTPSDYLLYGDEEGNTPLHVSASKSAAGCVEVLCQWMQGVDDLYAANLKGQHAAHLAGSAAVLQTLYENGADLWVPDPKQRCPLFMASFHGRLDAVAFLLEVGMDKKLDMIRLGDFQGDTALHAACLCGRLRCVALLLYFLRDTPNHHGLTPAQLAAKAGHHNVAACVVCVEEVRVGDPSLQPQDIFQCSSFENLSAITIYYGSRWTKLYDPSADAVYFLDRVTGHSQWERPPTYDMEPKAERALDAARECLRTFYLQYNPSKLESMNDILHLYKGKYTELFIELAGRYSVDDLSIFQGVYIEDGED